MWILSILITLVNGDYFSPEQVHLAWADDLTSMSVTWASMFSSYGSSIQYTPISSHSESVNSYLFSSEASWASYPNKASKGLMQRHLYVCKGYMINLIPGQLYAYRVGSNMFGWSKNFSFKARRNFTDADTARFLIYGDLSAGEENIPTISRLNLETYNYEYDAVIHNGDFMI